MLTDLSASVNETAQAALHDSGKAQDVTAVSLLRFLALASLPVAYSLAVKSSSSFSALPPFYPPNFGDWNTQVGVFVCWLFPASLCPGIPTLMLSFSPSPPNKEFQSIPSNRLSEVHHSHLYFYTSSQLFFTV